MSIQVPSKQSARDCLQVWEAERKVKYASGNKREYGIWSECAV